MLLTFRSISISDDDTAGSCPPALQIKRPTDRRTIADIILAIEIVITYYMPGSRSPAATGIRSFAISILQFSISNGLPLDRPSTCDIRHQRPTVGCKRLPRQNRLL